MNPSAPAVPIAAGQPAASSAPPAFAPVPAPTPDQSILPTPNVQFQAPDAVALPTINFGQFGTDFGAAATAASKSNSDLIAAQEAQKKGIFNQYQSAISAFGNPGDIYNKLSSAYGIPLYQQQMNTLRGLLSHLDDNVTSRVQGSNLTVAQRDALYANEQKPLNQQLGDIGNYLGTATSNLTNQMDLYNKGEQMALDPFKTYLGTLDSTFGNQLSALGNSNKGGLDAVNALIQKQADEEKLAEQKREADQQASLDQMKIRLAGSSNGSGISGYLGGSGTKGPSGPTMTQRMGGGFNFTDPSGKPISAAKYAQMSGNDIASVLRTMAQSGDSYAANAYASLSKVNNPTAKANVIKNFSQLFWGT